MRIALQVRYVVVGLLQAAEALNMSKIIPVITVLTDMYVETVLNHPALQVKYAAEEAHLLAVPDNIYRIIHVKIVRPAVQHVQMEIPAILVKVATVCIKINADNYMVLRMLKIFLRDWV